MKRAHVARIALLTTLLLTTLLHAGADAGSSTTVFLPLVFGPPAAVQAPVLKWQEGGCQTTWCRTGWYASPAVADLDGDQQPEIIWADYRIMALNGADGSTRWSVATPGGGRTWPGVVVADVDGGGGLEIITAHGGGWLSVLDAEGNARPGWPRQIAGGAELRSLAVDDVDDNGDLEILVCATRSNDQWFLFDHDGGLRPGWPVHSPDSDSNGYAAGCFNQNVALGNLDGDAFAEMIGPNDTHYVVGYNHDAVPLRTAGLYGQVDGLNKVWARVGFHLSHVVDLRGYANCSAGVEPLEPRPNFADSAPTLADVDDDGSLEIIIVGNQYDCRTSPYTSLYQLPYVLNADRTRWSNGEFDWETLPAPPPNPGPLSEDYNVIETAPPNPVAADLDGDGRLEILYAGYDGRLHAYWLDKTAHGNWPAAISNPGEGLIRFAAEPLVVDLNGDGPAEVITTSWTQKGSDAGGELLIFSWDGTLLHRVPLPRAAGQSWDGALAAPTIANVDGDADLELVVGTVHTGVVVYDLPGSTGAQVRWGTGRGSVLRTGQAP